MELLEHLHPKLVHFPIAFFLGAWFLDALSRVLKRESVYKAAMCIYVMAAFSSLLAVLSGLQEADHLHLKHPILYAHRNYALALLAVAWVGMVLLWAMRKKDPNVVRRVFTIACWMTSALVIAAAYFGGEMVYEYGIGVNP